MVNAIQLAFGFLVKFYQLWNRVWPNI